MPSTSLLQNQIGREPRIVFKQVQQSTSGLYRICDVLGMHTGQQSQVILTVHQIQCLRCQLAVMTV
jgi:hypothetical protein